MLRLRVRAPLTVRLRSAAALLALLAVFLGAGLVRAETIVLYDKPSSYSHIVVTQESDGLRTLRFERGGARQSVVKPDDPGYLALPYARVALIGLALCEAPERMLVVGLGGGSLPRFLRKHYPAATIDVVDIDPDVVHVSKEYFGFREDERMRAHVADGRAYIEQTRTPYDVIFLDAFGATSVPAHMTTVEFLGAVRRALRPDGVVVGNLWSGEHNRLYDAMARTYEAVFDTVKIVPVTGTGNRIVLALPRKEAVDTRALASRATGVSASRKFDFDLGAAAAEEAAHERESIRTARVLRDPAPAARNP
jgi:spermidine synthase